MKGERGKYHANLASLELREVYKNIEDIQQKYSTTESIHIQASCRTH